MCLRRSVVRISALSALTAATSLFSACRTLPSTDPPDAARSIDASIVDAASANNEDAAAALPIASAAPVPVPTSTSIELAGLLPPANPFTGTYRCFGGMKLDQSGRIVTATIHKGTTDTVIACTAGIDTCTGTVREITTVRGKPPKVLHVKPLTLTRTKSGDIVYVVESPEKKGAHADKTLCPRR